MLLNTTKQDITRVGLTQESHFHIQANSKSFEILSSGLYTNPIEAVVRELSCNAFDAHIDEKNEQPFQVHLPNHLEPYFSVKDWGTGLTDKQIAGTTEIIDGEETFINGLYTTYFSSTKTDSNDFIGALGLGSKSPFSYSKAFEVISRYEGKRTTFSVFLNEDGIPSIAKMGTIATDERNGIEVVLTVRPDDFDKFENAAKRMLLHFSPTPVFTGNKSITFGEADIVAQGDHWKISSDDRGKITAIQGNVPYPIDIWELSSELRKTLAVIKSDNELLLFFNIGSLDVAANRESIRYDERSINNLSTALTLAMVQYQEFVYDAISDSLDLSYWEFQSKLPKMLKTFNITQKTAHHIMKKYSGDDIHPHIAMWIKYGYGIQIPPSLINDVQHNIQRIVKLSRTSHTLVGFSRSVFKPVYHTLFPDTNTTFIIRDINQRTDIRLSAWFKTQHRQHKVVYIYPRPGVTTDAAIKTISSAFGNPKIEILSEITPECKKPKSPKLQSQPTVAKKIGHNTFSHKHHDISSFKSKLYILTNGGRVQTHLNVDTKWYYGYSASQFNMYSQLRFLVSVYNKKHNTKWSVEDIAVLNQHQKKGVISDPEWTNLFIEVDKYISSKDTIINLNETISNTSRFIKNLFNNEYVMKSMKKVPKDSTFRVAFNLYRKAVLTLERYKDIELDKLEDFRERYSTTADTFKLTNEPLFNEKEITKKYPLLKSYVECGTDDKYKKRSTHIIDYVNMIEQFNTCPKPGDNSHVG